MFLQRLAIAVAALVVATTPAAAQEVQGLLQIHSIPAVEGVPGETIAFQLTVDRLCPPGYVAEAAEASLQVTAPNGFEVLVDPLAFEPQICAVENPQTSSARLTVTVRGEAYSPRAHTFTVEVAHPDQGPPYPPMTYEPAHAEFSIAVKDAAEETEPPASRGDADAAPSVATPSLGAAPVLVALAAAAVALRRL